MKIALNLVLSLACVCIVLSKIQAQCDFTASPQALCNPLTIDFEVIMPVGGGWLWQFGDGGASNGSSPTHTYATGGTYTVTLLQGGVVCSSQMIVVDAPATPTFNVSSTTVCGYEDIEFSIPNPNPSVQYLWDFGDGNTDTSYTLVHAFASQATTQTYTVTLSENGIICGEPITITVLDAPDPTISSPGSFVECSGTETATITVENQSVTDASNTSYTIDWGDGSPTENPSSGWTELTHTYTSEGFFDISVTATGPFTCPSATVVYPFFNGSNPGGGITSPGGTTGLCISDTLTFFISGTDDNPVGTIYEVYENGELIMTFDHPPPQSFTHVFDESSCGETLFIPPITHEDSYGISLAVSNSCGSTGSVVGPITISGAPTAGFVFDTLVAFCTGVTIPFENTSVAPNVDSPLGCSGGEPVEDVTWAVTPTTGWAGDLNQEDVEITFIDQGEYNVTVSLTNCGATEIYSTTITIYEPPVANINIPDNVLCENETLTMQNISSENSTDFEWEILPDTGWVFLDTTNINSENPLIQFDLPGTYDIVLTASNGCTSDTWQGAIQVINTVVDAGMGEVYCASDAAAIPSQPAPTGGTWSGTGVTNPNTGLFDPSVSGVGNFILTYTYTSPLTGCTVADTIHVGVDPLPEINAGDDLVFCANEAAQLFPDATPEGGIWSGAIVADSVFDISAAGIYPVTYTYTSEGGCSDSDELIVTIESPPFVSAGNDRVLCIEESDFSLIGAPEGGTWFGVGIDTAGIFNTEFSGIYNAYYGIGEGTCYNQDSATIIVIDVRPTTPELFLCVDDIDVDLNQYIDIQPDDLLQPLSVNTGVWSGESVTPEGIFNPPNVIATTTFEMNYAYVQTSGMSCDETLIVTVNPLPSAAFQPIEDDCVDVDLNFLGASSGANQFEWDMDNGDTIYLENFNYSYNEPGNYTITLTATNSATGCSDVYTQNLIINDVLQADFDLIPDGTCSPVTVDFNNLSFGDELTYSWNFDNGQTSSTVNPPAMTYEPLLTEATYNVILAIENNCGTSTHVEQFTVQPVPLAQFTAPDPICDGDEVTFNNFSYGDPDTYQWFIDGVFFSDEFEPTQTLFLQNDVPTDYTITLVTTNECGTDTYEEIITVFDSEITGVFTVDDAAPCELQAIQFNSLDPPNANFIWDFGDGNFSTNPNPTHTYISAGNYTVTLLVDHLCGGIVESEVDVSVSGLPEISFAHPESICEGIEFVFENATSDAVNSDWSFGDGSSSNFTSPTHTYDAPGIYDIMLISTSGSGFCVDSMASTIEIFEAPEPELEATDLTCYEGANGSINTTIIGGAEPYTYNWDNNSDVPNPVNLDAGIYVLTVTTAEGCEALISAELNQPPPLVLELDGTDSLDCYGSTAGVIDLTISGGAQDYVFEWNTGSNEEDLDSLGVDAYSVTVTDMNGCEITDSHLIVGPLNPFFYEIETSIVSCYGGENGHAILEAFGGTSPYTYIWNTGVNGALLDSVSAGNYAFNIIDANDCEIVDTVHIAQNPPISVVDSILEVTCYNYSDGAIQIDSILGGVEPYLASLSPDFSGPDMDWLFTEDGRLFENLPGGDYTVYVQDSEGCLETYDYTLFNPFEVTVDLPDEIAIILGDSVELNPFLQLPNLTYNWFPAYALNCTDCANPIANPTENTTYTLTVMNENGCTASDDVKVIIDDEFNIFIPNVFSPNDDGANDIFMIFGDVWVQNVRRLSIYDRWGELIHEKENFLTNDPDYGWDGTQRGKKMNPAVFVYYAEIEFRETGVIRVYTGTVTLMR